MTHSTGRLRQRKQEMHKFFRFLYLNAYSFLLLAAGLAIIIPPLYKRSFLLLIPQIALTLVCMAHSAKLFSSWGDKKTKYTILLKKNQNGFRPDVFEIFMKAPCGRLLTKAVLKDLGIKNRYKELLVYKTSIFSAGNCRTQETKIFISEELK